jgi:antiviral helicase SKI2
MLPSYVNLIFLSATTPNTVEFSDWIGRTKRKPIHVIRTDYRPVPLSHHLWAGLATKALLPPSAKDPKKKGDAKLSRPPATGSRQLAWQAQGSKQNWISLIRFLDRELLTPSVVFSFSQKKCEEIAHMLRSMDLNTAKERSAVQAFCGQAVARLSQSDAKLPQVLSVCEMVQRGIGIHHGGLLPILKEVVELLFGRGLIKVLFATETFVSTN